MPLPSTPHFSVGDQVEVIRRESGANSFTYYSATVLRAPSAHKTHVLIEYQTLMAVEPDGPGRIREVVNSVNLRPAPPRGEVYECFLVNNSVDAYSGGGWRKGTITDILEDSKYIVGLDGCEGEGFVVQQCNLRLHREWVHGSSSWVPPLLQPPQQQQEKVEGKPRNLKLKIKFGKRKKDEMFEKGSLVEVTSDEEGYVGAWYGALIVSSLQNDKFVVQYLNLLTEDKTQQLREIASAQHVRPFPPTIRPASRYKLFEKVDAWYNEGWWEGSVSSVMDGCKYMVYFSPTREFLEFMHSELRPHYDWINGEWIKGKSPELGCDEIDRKVELSKGMKVEVKSDNVGFQGMWFAATIINAEGNDKFWVQYANLLTDDETDFLRKVVAVSDIRLSPPHTHRGHPFELCEIVDAWYNDGWWVGHVVKVQANLKYTVRFKSTEELEFDHNQLRPHQELINGDWIIVPQDWKF